MANVLSTTRVARCVAVVMSLVMTNYLLTDAVHRDDNPFLVPDVLVAVLLGGSASLPRRLAAPAMLFAFAWTAGVITVSLFSYVVRGEFAVGNLALILVSVAMAVPLAYRLAPGRQNSTSG